MYISLAMIDCTKDLIRGSSRKEAWLKQVDSIKAADKKLITEDTEANKNN